jgi:hypothetical protein
MQYYAKDSFECWALRQAQDKLLGVELMMNYELWINF